MNKKQLYESIMKQVSIEVKKALNESSFYDSINYNDNEYIGDIELYDTCGVDLYEPGITIDQALTIMKANFPFNFSKAFELRRWFTASEDIDIFWNDMVNPELILQSWFVIKRNGRLTYIHFGDVNEGDIIIAWGEHWLLSDYLGYYLSANDIDVHTIWCPSGKMYEDSIYEYKKKYDIMYGRN